MQTMQCHYVHEMSFKTRTVKSTELIVPQP